MGVEQIGSQNDDGLNLGVSASDKIAFHGADPIVQESLVADGTDAATTQTLANAIKASLVLYGLLA
jgi:hypothetical protein